MVDQQTGPRDPDRVETAYSPEQDRIIRDQASPATSPQSRQFVGSRPGTEVGEDVMTVRDRLQWGPILGGLVTTVAAMLLLTVLGLAIGASAFDPATAGETLGWGAAIWGAASAIVAFFLGGWVAAKSAAVPGQGTGLLNGLMVGAAAITLMLLLTGAGLGNVLGTLGANVGDIAAIAQDEGIAATDAEAAVDDAVAAAPTAQEAFDVARDGAWGTFIALSVALGAAAVGGLVGYNKRRELIEGTG